MSELLKGKIAGLTEIKRSAKNWVDYEVSFTDGTTAKIVVPPDRKTPVKGDTIECKKGQFAKWQLDVVNGDEHSDSPTEAPAKKPYEKPKSERENYWTEKSNYEEQIRDPKIEFQFYLSQVVSMYNTNVPLLPEDQRPSTLEEVDGLFDQAFDKAKAVFNTINKK